MKTTTSYAGRPYAWARSMKGRRDIDDMLEAIVAKVRAACRRKANRFGVLPPREDALWTKAIIRLGGMLYLVGGGT